MKFKEFLKLIKQFDCKALEDKEVEHFFVDSNLYTYKETVIDFAYDKDSDKFTIICDKPESFYFKTTHFIKGKTAQ